MLSGMQDSGYDRGSLFSPQGRLFQVEYASQAVARGSTALALKTKESVVMIAERRQRTRLIDPNTIKKIFIIDDHLAVVAAGISADARILIEYARQLSQIFRLTYGSRCSVEYIVRRLANVKQSYTQYSGVRPFGVSLLLMGIDESGLNIFNTEPSGAYWGYQAVAIGRNANNVNRFLEHHYQENLSHELGLRLGLEAMARLMSVEERTEPRDDLEMLKSLQACYIHERDQQVKFLSLDELKTSWEEVNPPLVPES